MSNVVKISNPSSPYMDKAMLSEFQKILRALQEKYSAATMLNSQPIEITKMPDDTDVATLVEAANIEMISRDRDFAMGNAIRVSLHKVKTGEYGYCDDCDTEIGVKRLKAQPTACLCISCQEIKELKRSQFSRHAA